MTAIYALGAEWQALMDPATEPSVAHLKLAWWQEEMQRLAAHRAVHPISKYLAAQPRAAAVDFAPLVTAVRAAAAQINGAPLELGTDLEPQSQSLWGGPMVLASQLAFLPVDEDSLRVCTGALAAAHYLTRAIGDYRREARVGRVPFAVDELLAAGVENGDLAADAAPPHLRVYLDRQRERAAGYFDSAARALPRAQRRQARHLLVLAALGRRHLEDGAYLGERRRFKDMLLAWTTARRAHR